MFLIRNSVKNIYRYRSRYILLGVILLIIVIFASVLIGIFNYTSLTTETLKNKYGSVFKVSKDNCYDLKNFDKADYDLFNDCEYVNSVKFNSFIISTVSMGHTRYDITDEHKGLYSAEDYEKLLNMPEVVEAYLTVNGEERKLRELNVNPVYIMGYEYSDLPEEKKARFVMESGRMYENGGECVIAVNDKIEDEAWNLLGVGDSVRISVYEGIEKEYTVTGILRSDENISADTKTRVLFTTFESAEEFKSVIKTDANSQTTSGPVNNSVESEMLPAVGAENMPIEQYEVTVELKSYENYNDFRYYVNVTLDGYVGMPLYENFQDILELLNQSYYWSIIFIVITGLILVFTTVIATIVQLSGRKYEIAVLRSSGMKKSRIILSYLIENLTFVWSITVIALIAAQFIEPLFIKNISGSVSMISPEILKIMANVAGFELMLKNTGIVFAGMTVIVMLSLVLTCINIVRFEPLKIFTKQY